LTWSPPIAGLELEHLLGKTTDSFELSFRYGDMKLDIFFFYPSGEVDSIISQSMNS
jgi:hypothetical protein